jgi:hypothetical protein
MSTVEIGGVKREYSFTVRLSAEEKVALETLAERFQLDKSATVRRALQLILVNGKSSLPDTGRFVPLHAEALAFLVRLSGKGADGGSSDTTY